MSLVERSVYMKDYDLAAGRLEVAADIFKLHLRKAIHTGIEVYGREFYWAGVEQDADTSYPMHAFKTHPISRSELGKTKVNFLEFEEFLEKSNPSFQPGNYKLMYNNCNNFSSTVALFLGVQDIYWDYLTQGRSLRETTFGTIVDQLLLHMNTAVTGRRKWAKHYIKDIEFPDTEFASEVKNYCDKVSNTKCIGSVGMMYEIANLFAESSTEEFKIAATDQVMAKYLTYDAKAKLAELFGFTKNETTWSAKLGTTAEYTEWLKKVDQLGKIFETLVLYVPEYPDIPYEPTRDTQVVELIDKMIKNKATLEKIQASFDKFGSVAEAIKNGVRDEIKTISEEFLKGAQGIGNEVLQTIMNWERLSV